MATEDFASEAELFDEQALARRSLERSTRAAAEVMVDLEGRGALYTYVKERAEAAAKAMIELVTVDPTDTAKIFALQRIAALYLDTVEWLHGRLESGREADQHIREDYQDRGPPPQD